MRNRIIHSSLASFTSIALLAAPAATAEIPADWVTTYADAPSYQARAFDVDSAGNSYVIADLGTTTNADVAVAKFDAEGNLVWQSVFAGPVGQDIAKDIKVSSSESAVYAIGRSTVPGFGNSDWNIIKYNSATGGELWQVFYNGPSDQIDDPEAAAATPDDGIAVTGSVFNGDERSEFATVKFDTNGNVVWDQIFGDVGPFLFNEDTGQVINVTADGDVIASGHVSPCCGGDDVVTFKYDGDTGDQLWMARYSTSANENVRDQAIAPDGDVVVFGTDPFGIDRQWLTIRYDGVTGAEQWTSLIDPGNDEFVRAVAVAPDGTIYTTGATDPDGDDDNFNNNIITMALDGDSGSLLWLEEFGGLGFNEDDRASDVIVDDLGRLFVVGSSSSKLVSGNSINSDALLLQHDRDNGDIMDMGRIDTTQRASNIIDDLFSEGKLDAAGNLYTQGSTFDDPSGSEVLLTRFAISESVTGDLNGDGLVNQSDLGILLSAFGIDATGDLDGDNDTDQADLGILLANFGRSS